MQKREEIIKRLLAQSAEVITPEEFERRLASGEKLTHYIGFEISGYVHIGQGMMSALVMKDLTDLGVKCTLWLADWHTWINKKLDGTKETAANIGIGYFAEAIRACFMAVGGDPALLDIRLASSAYSNNAMQYWETVVAVAMHTTDARIKRSISIMGKEAGESVEFATLMYPVMQVADIFFLRVDIAHASMDQRKAHVVMRDVADKVAPDRPKPMALHHPLIDSLDGEQKMSKSKPDTAVFVHDEPAEIERKIKKAFCQEKEIAKNPILNWTKNILFWNRTSPFVIEREEKHGGKREFTTYADLEAAFAAGEVHPMDLKSAVAKEIIALLEPVRKHFADPQHAAEKAALDKVLANR